MVVGEDVFRATNIIGRVRGYSSTNRAFKKAITTCIGICRPRDVSIMLAVLLGQRT